MTPATTPLPIYKGAKFEHALVFYESETDNVIDLSGLGPFTAVICHATKDEVLVELTVTVTAPETGAMVLTASAAQTDTLRLGTVRLGLSDGQGNPYIASTCPVLFFPHS
jgi:hypothetical protein